MVGHLVRDHVGAREGPEPDADRAAERVEEARVEVDAPVRRAVEGPDGGALRSAGGMHLVVEDRQARRCVLQTAASNSRVHIASASWNTAVRKALSLVAGEAARLVGPAAAGTFGRRPTSAPVMLVFAEAVVAVPAARDVLDAVPPEDPQPAAATAVPASTMIAAQRAASGMPRSRTR